MNNLKIYRITLTPLDAFFFGSEQTFGFGEESNYYAVSNLYPQQTALLGMLRQEILFQNNKDFSLIGEQSFKADGTVSDFGVIKQISPLMILKKSDNDEEYLVWQSLEFLNKPDTDTNPVQLSISNDTYTRFSDTIHKDFLPVLDHYDEKLGIKDALASCATGRSVPDDSNIFIPVFQVGILKKSEKEGFFKKVSYKLGQKYHFVLFAALDASSHFSLEDNLIIMGGDRSPFVMHLEDHSDKLNPINEPGAFYKNLFSEKTFSGRKLVLISDALVTEDLYELSVFTNGALKDFRNIRSTKNTGNFNALQKDDEKATNASYKSSRFYLLRRGSVIYFSEDKEAEIKKQLDNSAWQKIGFNHYKIL